MSFNISTLSTETVFYSIHNCHCSSSSNRCLCVRTKKRKKKLISIMNLIIQITLLNLPASTFKQSYIVNLVLFFFCFHVIVAIVPLRGAVQSCLSLYRTMHLYDACVVQCNTKFILTSANRCHCCSTTLQFTLHQESTLQFQDSTGRFSDVKTREIPMLLLCLTTVQMKQCYELDAGSFLYHQSLVL